MNKDTVKGDWKQLSGKIKEKCGLKKDKTKQQLKALGIH